MQRREVLKGLAVLSGSAVLGVPLDVRADTRPLWQRRGEQLCRNLDALYAQDGGYVSEAQRAFEHAACYRISEQLDKWETTEMWATPQSNPPIPFGVASEVGEARRLKIALPQNTLSCLEDIRALHGIDPVYEGQCVIAFEVVHYIHREVRSSPQPIRSYRIHAVRLNIGSGKRPLLYYTRES